MHIRVRSLIFFALLFVWLLPGRVAHAKSYIAYISDSTNSSVIYWIAKEAGILKKHGLDLDTIFINGSVRGIQSLIAGDLGYTGAVGTAVINAKLAGGDIAIVQSQMNTLPYFIIGNASIADVSIQRSDLLVVTGKSFGITNIIALDSQQNIVEDRRVIVQRDELIVNVQKGGKRESFNCSPQCNPTITIGDDPEYFDTVAKMSEQKMKLSQGKSGGNGDGN